MKRMRWILTGSLILIAAVAASAAGDHSFNSSVRVADGEVREGDLSALNGGITVGEGATVHGDCESVNGGISVGRNAVVEAVSSVNGSVDVGSNAEIKGEVEAVNGRISLDQGARATRVSTVNGSIKLTGAEVERDVSTVNGDINLRDGANVGGNIVIEETNGNHRNKRDKPIYIELEGGSVVEGDVIVEDPKMTPVKLILREGSRVLGRVQGAEIEEG